MYTDPLHFPARGSNWLRIHALGTLLVLGSVLVIPGLAVLGYGLRVLRAGLRNASEPPPFEEWRALVRDGARVLAVSLAYFAPAIAIDAASPFLRGSLGDVLSLAWFLAVVAGGYVLPMALARLAVTDSLAAAVDLAVLAEIVRTREYLRGWIVVAGLWTVIALGGIKFLVFGVFVLLLYFYLFVALAYAFGQLYRRLSEERLISDSAAAGIEALDPA